MKVKKREQQAKEKQTIVLCSGGLDSTVLLCKLKAEGRDVKALSVDYGQRHRRELDAGAAVCELLGVERRVANLSALRQFLGGSSQTDSAVPVPHGHYAAENMKLTVVPNRNAILLSVAFAWAISLKYNSVAYAAHSGDHAIYPDCREEFTRPFAESMMHADWHVAELERPFIHYTKAEVVKVGDMLGAQAAMALSYSCYDGGDTHCALCGTCQERRSAFRDAGVKDPTIYNPAGLASLPDSMLVS